MVGVNRQQKTAKISRYYREARANLVRNRLPYSGYFWALIAEGAVLACVTCRCVIHALVWCWQADTRLWGYGHELLRWAHSRLSGKSRAGLRAHTGEWVGSGSKWAWSGGEWVESGGEWVGSGSKWVGSGSEWVELMVSGWSQVVHGQGLALHIPVV